MKEEKKEKHWMIRNFPIYLRKEIRIEALKKEQTVSEYVTEAVKRGMKNDGTLPA